MHSSAIVRRLRMPPTNYDELKEAIAAALPGDVAAAAADRALRAGAAQRAGARHRGGDRRGRRRAAVGDGPLRQRARTSAASREMQQVFRGAPGRALGQLPRAHRAACASGKRKAAAAGAAGVLHQFVGEAIAELGHLEENVQRRASSTPRSRLLAGAPRIHVLAQRRAFPVACYLAYALSQLELRDAPARRRRRHAARSRARHRAARRAARR